MVVGATQKSFQYDAFKRRYYKKIGTATEVFYFYDFRGQLLSEYQRAVGDPNPPAWQKNYYYIGGRLVKTDATPTGTFLVWTNRLGTVRLTTDVTGFKTAIKANYYPYGQEIPPTTAQNQPKFTGYYRDDEGTTTIDYAINRYYASGIARFFSVDVGPPSPKYPTSWNRYAYVNDDPTNFTDPDGRLMKLPDPVGDCGGGGGGIDPPQILPQCNVNAGDVRDVFLTEDEARKGTPIDPLRANVLGPARGQGKITAVQPSRAVYEKSQRTPKGAVDPNGPPERDPFQPKTTLLQKYKVFWLEEEGIGYVGTIKVFARFECDFESLPADLVWTFRILCEIQVFRPA